MTVPDQKAIIWRCESCGEENHGEYSLLRAWDIELNTTVSADMILCSICGHDNRVIMMDDELERIRNEA